MAYLSKVVQGRDTDFLGSMGRRGGEEEWFFVVRKAGMHGGLPWDGSGAR